LGLDTDSGKKLVTVSVGCTKDEASSKGYTFKTAKAHLTCANRNHLDLLVDQECPETDTSFPRVQGFQDARSNLLV
jgi:hypothetical protein